MINKKIENKKSYIVYDADWNIDTQTDNYEEAVKRYEELKQQWIDSYDGEFSGDERVNSCRSY